MATQATIDKLISDPNYPFTLTVYDPEHACFDWLDQEIVPKMKASGRQLIDLDMRSFESIIQSDVDPVEIEDQFMLKFAQEFGERAGAELVPIIKKFWRRPLANSHRVLRCAQAVFEQKPNRFSLVVRYGEVLATAQFSDTFYGMLRAWHNLRASKKIWCNLDLLIVVSEPSTSFIDDINQSPFNIGTDINYQDLIGRELI